jgi:hypothetical protein
MLLSRLPLVVLLPCLLLVLSACEPSRDDYRQKCLSGEMNACSKACELGIHGEGGCLTGANTKHPQRRTELLIRACRGNLGDACVEAARSSITLSMSNPKQYESLLEQGCKLGSHAGCRLWGDYLLADSFAQAQKAYLRACELAPADTAQCGPALQQRLNTLERDDTACNKGEVGACERLLHEAAGLNHDVAYRAAHQVCKLRGLSEYYATSRIPFAYKLRKRKQQYEGCGLFLLARAAHDPHQRSRFRRSEVPPASVVERGGRVELTSVNLHFRQDPQVQPEAVLAAKNAIAAQLEQRLKLAKRCVDQHLEAHASADGTAEANFILDRLGEPLELRAAGQSLDSRVSDCVISAAVPEVFTGDVLPLRNVVHVQAMMRVFGHETLEARTVEP